MLELFSNPFFVAAGGALVSSPIIIHLINRLRFKRLRWAAMEFLLKAQKRNRRRLIIEQLLLLLLRCMLVLLATFLVSRFIGFTFGGYSGTDGLHVVILDDTLSMQEQFLGNNNDNENAAFKVAKNKIIMDQIVKNVAKSTTNERLVILPLSEVYRPKYLTARDTQDLADSSALQNWLLQKDKDHPEMPLLVYQNLKETEMQQIVLDDLKKLQPTKQRLSLIKGIEKAKEIFQANSELRPTLHIVSDIRLSDWGTPEAKELHRAVKDLSELNCKVRILDTVLPPRADITKNQNQVLSSQSNLAIIDFRPDSRIVSRKMPVSFTITVANYGPNEQSVHLMVYNDQDGQELSGVKFDPDMPLKVPAGSTAVTRFSFPEGLDPNIPPDQKFYEEKLSAHLVTEQRTPLTNDPLPEDNIRYTTLEFRDEIPILLIDGNGAEGRKRGGDSFHIEQAVNAIVNARYKVEHGHLLSGGISGQDALKALERDDLNKYLCIFLLDVPVLTPLQQENLDHYLAEGGGVGIFLGPNVQVKDYNKDLVAGQFNFFPVPLQSETREIPKDQQSLDNYRFLLRKDKFGDKVAVPILEEVFPNSREMEKLKDLQVREYFPAARAEWRQALKDQEGKLFELAALLNDVEAQVYGERVLSLLPKLEVATWPEGQKYERYQETLNKHKQNIRDKVDPSKGFKAYDVSSAIDTMLKDQGGEGDAGLLDFWDAVDERVRDLRKEWETLREDTLYGDPFVVAKEHKGGRVVTVMSTAGVRWNGWGGAGKETILATYPLFVWKTLYYLSSSSSSVSRPVGSDVAFSFNKEMLKNLKKDEMQMSRVFFKANRGREGIAEQPKEVGRVDAEGKLLFTSSEQPEPGYYLYKLTYNQDKKANEMYWSHVFNVDAEGEGKLKRTSNSIMRQNLEPHKHENILVTGSDDTGSPPINRPNDTSESPWLYLLFLLLLITEQALAVHLSFTMNKGEENQLPAQANLRGRSTKAA